MGSRAAVPGALTVTGAAGGEQVFYYEGDARPGWRRLNVRVSGPDRATVPVSAYHGDLEYDIDGRVAKAIAIFATRTGGHYRVTATVAVEPGAKLAVGRDLAGDIRSTALWAGVSRPRGDRRPRGDPLHARAAHADAATAHDKHGGPASYSVRPSRSPRAPMTSRRRPHTEIEMAELVIAATATTRCRRRTAAFTLGEAIRHA